MAAWVVDMSDVTSGSMSLTGVSAGRVESAASPLESVRVPVRMWYLGFGESFFTISKAMTFDALHAYPTDNNNL